MNIQTTHLEKHKARLTVEVEPERLDKAKLAAARQIAKRVNIPGFRKGKAPYKILANYVGEATILEDAIELLGNEVYKEALGQSDIDPFGPGELEDFRAEPQPTFIFTVALQPEVDLKDYRSVRLDYEPPVVDDEMVNRAMKMMQEQEALVEESHQPVAIGNRVTLDIHSFFVDEDEGEGEGTDEAGETEESEETEGDGVKPASDEAEESDDEDLHAHDDEEVFIHQHDATVRLSTDDEPVLLGFSEALVGTAVDETREFELTVPADDEYDETVAGRRVKFHVTVKKIETMTLPALNDEFAAKVTESEDEPLTLLDLRIRVRENLEKENERRAKSDYGNHVLEKIIEQASISYPEALVLEQTEEFLKDLDQRLRKEGLNLDDYMRVMGKTKEDLYADYREPATRSVERQLAMIALLDAEKVQVSEEDADQRIGEMATVFGDKADSMRSVFDTPQMRTSIKNELLQQKVFDRISDIAQGKVEEAETSDEGSETVPAPSDETVSESEEQTS